MKTRNMKRFRLQTIATFVVFLLYATAMSAQGIIVYKKGGTAIKVPYEQLDSISTYDYDDSPELPDNPDDPENPSETIEHEYVDLGLSVKWATCNVGATKPEEYGDYFAWGATEPLYESGYAQENPQSHWKSGKTGGYNWVNAPYQTANTTSYSSIKWTKYLGSTTSSYKDPSATDADALKTVLDPEDDAAHVNWGGSWRMPTYEELNELCTNCTWTWTTINGINGYKVQSKKSGYTDRWIFLPAAGYRDDTHLNRVGSGGDYWSSSLSTGGPYGAYFLDFNSDDVGWYHDDRDDGQSVRPVCQ